MMERESGSMLMALVGGQYYNAGPLNNNTEDLFIGNRWNSGSLDRTFNGIIDEVRIYDRRLLVSEIQLDMSNSLPVERPMAAWSFEEQDSARYVNDTSIWVDGYYGSALSFDCNNDVVNITDIPNTSLTVMAWIASYTVKTA